MGTPSAPAFECSPPSSTAAPLTGSRYPFPLLRSPLHLPSFLPGLGTMLPRIDVFCITHTHTCVQWISPSSLLLQSWPDDALTIVARRFLDDIEMDDTVKEGCVEMCKEFHQTTRKLSDRFLATLQRHNYVTPTSYLELISTYKTLLAKKRRYLTFCWVTWSSKSLFSNS